MATAEKRLQLLRQAQRDGKRLLSNKDFAPLELQPFIETSTASAPVLSRLPRNTVGSRPRRVRSSTDGGPKRTAATSHPARDDDVDEPVEKVKPRRRVPVGGVLLRKSGLGSLLPNAEASSDKNKASEQVQEHERERIGVVTAASPATEKAERADLKGQYVENEGRRQPSSRRPAEDPNQAVPSSTQSSSQRPAAQHGLVQHGNKVTEAEQAKRVRLHRHVVAIVAAGIDPFRDILSPNEQQSRSDEVISILIEKESRAGDYAVCDYVDLLPYKHRMMLKFVGGFFDKLKRRAKAQVEPSPVKTSSRQETVPHGARLALGLLDEASQPRDRLEKAISPAQTFHLEETSTVQPAAPIDKGPLSSLAEEAGSVAHPEQSFGPTLDDFYPTLDGDGGETPAEMDWELSAGEIEGLGSPTIRDPQASGSVSLGPRAAPSPSASQTPTPALATRRTETEKANYEAATGATSSPAFRADREPISPMSPSLLTFADPAAPAPGTVDEVMHDATSSTRLTEAALAVLARISDSPLSSPASSSCDPADLANAQPLARSAAEATPGDAKNHAGLSEAALAVLAQISDSPLSSPASSVCDPADTAGTAGREGSTAQERTSKKKRKRVADAGGDDLEGAGSEPGADKLALLEPFRQDPCFPALVKYVKGLRRPDVAIFTASCCRHQQVIRLDKTGTNGNRRQTRFVMADEDTVMTGILSFSPTHPNGLTGKACMAWNGERFVFSRKPGGPPLNISVGRGRSEKTPWVWTKEELKTKLAPYKGTSSEHYQELKDAILPLLDKVFV